MLRPLAICPVSLFTLASIVGLGSDVSIAEETQSTPPREALLQAAEFFSDTVSVSGGYLWRYSADLELREGEGVVGATTAWVQPPGTPSVGNAFLVAYQLTGEDELKQDAIETAQALLRGQLESGGWDYRIEFLPQDREKYAYRVDLGGESAKASKRRNVTTLDDNTTQAALQFLIRLDRELDFQNAEIHEAAQYALDRLLEAQYPNGAWPQRFSAPPDAAQYPAFKATLPIAWPRAWPNKDYRGYYTFNDNTIADMIDTMFLAWQTYQDDRFRQSLVRAGDFILLAQLPEPQPAWAQQYNASMQPAWARKFEPASITGGESQAILNTLLDLYEYTRQPRFLQAVRPALDYLNRSIREDGRLARFYEFGTNRPLYFTKEYELTYQDDDLPTHYQFIVSNKLERLERRYQKLKATPRSRLSPPKVERPQPPSRSAGLSREAAILIENLDPRGAWVEEGAMRAAEGETLQVIDSRTFAENLVLLARFVSSK